MTFQTTPVDEPVRRVTYADIEGIEKWLLPMLLERWPNASVGGIQSGLHAALYDPKSCFVHTSKVVGLFQAEASVLDQRPAVVERFVRAQKVAKKETEQLYRFVLAWAKDIKAREMVVNNDNNIDISRVVTELELKAVVGPGITVTL
jgi:hypothetical protein